MASLGNTEKRALSAMGIKVGHVGGSLSVEVTSVGLCHLFRGIDGGGRVDKPINGDMLKKLPEQGAGSLSALHIVAVPIPVHGYGKNYVQVFAYLDRTPSPLMHYFKVISSSKVPNDITEGGWHGRIGKGAIVMPGGASFTLRLNQAEVEALNRGEVVTVMEDPEIFAE